MKTFFSFLLCLSAAFATHAQALRIDSTRFYCNGNATTFSEITCIIQTKDKGFFFTGRAGKPGGGILPPCPGTGANPVMGKLDSLGNIEWIKSFCDSATWAVTACQVPDGGYVTGGTCGLNGMVIYRYNAQGALLWERNYGKNAGALASQVIATPDSGFLLLGVATDRDSDITVTYDYPPRAFPTVDWVLLKLDSLGRKQWVRTLGTSGDELSRTVLMCDGKNYYFIGSTFSKDYDCADVAGHPGFAIYTIKLDSAGNVLWSKAHGAGFVSDVLFDERDNSILVTGRTNGGAFQEFSGLPVYGYDDIFLMKLDTAGNYKWGNIFGTNGVDEGHHICKAPNGGYFVAGAINNSGIASGILLSVDSNGSQVDMNRVNGTSGGGIYFNRVFPFKGGYGAFGMTGALNLNQGSGQNCSLNPTKGSATFCLSALDLIPLSTIEPSTSQSAFTLSPNPTRSSVEVRFEGQHSKGAITATNAEGKQMLRQQVRQDEQSIFLNTASWPPGTYLVCFQPEGKLSQCQKLLVQ